MGQDKAMIEIDDMPMIRRIYEAIASCRSPDCVIATGLKPSDQQIFVVTPWPQRYQPILPIDCHFITDQQPDRGPLIAFAQAIAIIPSPWVFLVACDLPYLSTPLLQSWIDQLPSISSASIAYLPRHQSKGWEPLCGFYRQTCDRSVAAYVKSGGRSFQRWLLQHQVTELIVEDPMCLFNCNTQADLLALNLDLC
jgi:molybdenum cofactor guanylyltransferase